VIVMTSSKAEVDILKSYELRANGYIVKPVTFERLKEIVASIESFWFTVVVLPQAAPASATSQPLLTLAS
jgi:two-component system, chemotaxis family, response regulator Rcp1